MSPGGSPGYRRGYRLTDLENVLSEKGWSQADLARRSGLSTPTVKRAAGGREEVSPDSAAKIATALRVQVGTLCRHRLADARAERAERVEFDTRRMRKAMTDKGMNPSEMAAAAGLSVATVSSALQGLRNPRRSTAAKIAGVFGMDPADLYTAGTAPYKSAVPAPAAVSSEGGLRLVAGQSVAAVYPKEAARAETVDTPPEDDARPGAAVPVQAGEQSRGYSLGDLLSHIQQARQMMESLVSYIGALERQVSRAMSSEDDTPCRPSGVSNGQ